MPGHVGLRSLRTRVVRPRALLLEWNRLLGGDWKNALVGRDVLLGVMFGSLMAAISYFNVSLPYWVSASGLTPIFTEAQFLSGTRGFLSLIASLSLILENAVGTLALTFIGARITGSKLAGLGLTLLLGAIFCTTGDNLAIELPLGFLFMGLAVVCLARVGLLAACCAWFSLAALTWGTVTTDLSRWYAARGFLMMAIPLALAIYGFKVALAGRPLFGATF